MDYEKMCIRDRIISVSVVVLVVVLDVLAGFALSKLNFPFKNGIYIFLLSALLLPAAAILVPVFPVSYTHLDVYKRQGADNGILVTDRVLGGADTWATSQMCIRDRVVGSALNLKPVLAVRYGEVKVAGLARGQKGAREKLLKAMEKDGGMDKSLSLIHI